MYNINIGDIVTYIGNQGLGGTDNFTKGRLYEVMDIKNNYQNKYLVLISDRGKEAVKRYEKFRPLDVQFNKIIPDELFEI